MSPKIDITMLRLVISSEAGDAQERDRVRARRVVEYIRRRFPAVRYNDAPEGHDDGADRMALDQPDERKVT